MKVFVLFLLIFSSLTITGCATSSNAIQANGTILWSNGVVEKVRVSPSNEHFVFLHQRMYSSQVVVYSRIFGASTSECEFYVNEPKPEVRLTVCHEGEVELLENGAVINLGQLTVYGDF
ncbi:hypothetical protein [Enterovibrio norvegicus]|uniref:hypothetical protein n=1 Tax=Enterovibrio norvegicus TaxID=188144 RepID=UPI000CA991AD|nr:hypothetical protein [Enterovibrio norvegicus]PML75575.1 hypothetical protein BCT69_06345 [Enterovibrio norvegicus]